MRRGNNKINKIVRPEEQTGEDGGNKNVYFRKNRQILLKTTAWLPKHFEVTQNKINKLKQLKIAALIAE